MNRRTLILGAGALALLAACAPTTQATDPATVNALRVVSTQAVIVPDREFAVPEARIAAFVESRVGDRLAAVSASGTTDVTATVTVERIFISNPAAGLIGSSVSSIGGTVELRDSATGEVVVPAVDVSGQTEPRPTIFGAAAIQSPEAELEIITQDLAMNAGLALFGR